MTINRQKEIAFVGRIIETCELYTLHGQKITQGELAKAIGLVPADYAWNIGAQVNWLNPLVRSAMAHEKAHGRNAADLLKCLISKATGELALSFSEDWWGAFDHVTHDQRGTGKRHDG